MNLRALIVAVAALAITASAASAADITSSPAIARDLELAAQYWRKQTPELAAPCPITVTVEPMTPADGASGPVPISAIWAETVDGSCAIAVSPAAAPYATDGSSRDAWLFCVMIAHEYGHTLGLPDGAPGEPMMADSWLNRSDPLCDQSVYGWRGTSPTDRRWLTVNGLERRRARPVADP